MTEFIRKFGKISGVMKKLVFILFLATAALSLGAQDIVVLESGEAVKAKVTEIDDFSVRYRLYGEPEGVVYKVRKADVAKIIYESGRVETFGGSGAALLAQDADAGSADAIGVRPGMLYREYRPYYRPSEYMRVFGDPYSPGWSGVASFFIPGLGQMVSGEIGRGCAFLGGTIGLCLLTTLGSAALYDFPVGALGLAVGGSLALVAVDIWAIVDAVQVAKVKNMYYRDLRQKYPVEMKIYPSVGSIPTLSGNSVSAGLALAVRF